MAELIAGLIEGLFALIAIIIEAVAHLAAASVTVIAYLISPSYRQRKEKEWSGKPMKRGFELGVSGICLATLIGFGIWLSYPRPKSSTASPKIEVKEGSKEEDARISIRPDRAHGDTNEITLAVKKGGVTEIFATKSIADLKAAISNNVRVIKTTNQEGAAIPNKP